jgi:hypothetical protein
MAAAMGMVLNVSTKVFQILSENLRLPLSYGMYNNRTSRRVCLSMRIRGSPLKGRNFRGILPCTQRGERLSRLTASPDRSSLQEKDSSFRAESRRSPRY